VAVVHINTILLYQIYHNAENVITDFTHKVCEVARSHRTDVERSTVVDHYHYHYSHTVVTTVDTVSWKPLCRRVYISCHYIHTTTEIYMSRRYREWLLCRMVSRTASTSMRLRTTPTASDPAWCVQITQYDGHLRLGLLQMIERAEEVSRS